jgi:hypothetical protein
MLDMQAAVTLISHFMGPLDTAGTAKVKLALSLAKHGAMKTYGGFDVYIHAFLTSAVVGAGG